MAHVNEGLASSTSPNVRRIRELLARKHLLKARDLLKEALRDEPDNTELQRFQVILAPPEVTPVALNDIDRTAELRWIASHGKDYRREWIAVLGNRLVAHTSSLRELREALRKLSVNGTPLVHRIR